MNFFCAGENLVSKPSDEMAEQQGARAVGPGREPGADPAHQEQPAPGPQRPAPQQQQGRERQRRGD